jgi:predicted PurR-regulated permease PerM
MDINNISNRTIFRILAMISAFVGLAWLIYSVHHELVWVVMAFFLAIALNPAVEWLAKRMPKKSRGLAAGLVFFTTLVVLGVVMAAVIPPMVTQTQNLLRDFPHYTDQLTQSSGPIGQFLREHNLQDWVRNNQSQLLSRLSTLTGSIGDVARTVLSSVAATLTTLVLTFFMLLEGPYWINVLWQMQPADKRAKRQELAGKMYKTVTGYVNGNLLTSLVAAVATSIALSIVGIPFAIPLGIVIGIFDLLPLVGATIGALIVVLICLFTSVQSAVAMTIFFIIYQQLENHILQPIVYSKTLKMSPLSVFVAAIFGVALGGIVGALIAIPIAASLQILAKDLYVSRRTKA